MIFTHKKEGAAALSSVRDDEVVSLGMNFFPKELCVCTIYDTHNNFFPHVMGRNTLNFSQELGFR